MKQIVKTWCVATMLVAVLALPAFSARASTITTPEIISKSFSLSCLNYKIIGACTYLQCFLFYCKTKIVPKVSHRLPDFVVTAYNDPGETPWTEARAITGPLIKNVSGSIMGALTGFDIGGGHLNTKTGKDDSQTRFKEVDVIGHPMGVTRFLKGVPSPLCPSGVVPLLPYFNSTLDGLSWRSGVPDLIYPASYVPGMREIGTFPLNTWGAVLPRTGFVTQVEDPKSGAVAAQRAVDIVTRTGQPHVYIPYGFTGYQTITSPPTRSPTECKNIDPLSITDPSILTECMPFSAVTWLSGANERTDKWQMLSPVPESSCRSFGVNDTVDPMGWSWWKTPSDEGYTWNYWREYKCCWPTAGIFLFSVEW